MKVDARSMLAALFVAGAATADPVVTITPPKGARFFPGQRFDIRVEAKGKGRFSATMAVDGKCQGFSSPRNACPKWTEPSATPDGITPALYGGFNLRGFSSNKPGTHTITAKVTDDEGTTTAAATFVVQAPRPGHGGRTRNVIILLGDGMGAAHRTAARLVEFGATGGDPNGYLAMDGFPGTGTVITHSLNSIVTDSAPGMACYTTGNHAQNGQEGVYPARMTNPFYYPRVEYMSEYLHRVKGTSTGIVSTADLEDATPAANAVHTGNRNAGTGIVDQYFDERNNTGLTVLMGGGRRWFLPKGQYGSSRAAESDYGPLPGDLQAAWSAPAGAIDEGRDLLADFRNGGFTYVSTATELSAAGTPEKLIGLFGYGNMNVALDKIAKRRDPSRHGVVDDYHEPDQPMLDEMTAAALRVLSRNKRGFFLMVEGAHIDKQSHLMDAERTVGEVIEFDRAVGVARKWADKLGNTIVIVVADHECAGFSVIGALRGTVAQLGSLSSDADNLDPDPAVAEQPARLAMVGTYDSAAFPKYELAADGYPKTYDVDGKILFGFGGNADRHETWLTRPLPIVDSLLPSSIKAELAEKGYSPSPPERSADESGFFVRGQVPGDQAVHTASDVPISAYSTGSDAWRRFVGVQRNTDVFFKLMEATAGSAAGGDR
ncbi:MAG: alkaline phosphatase [Deltaproteobacteria bacterium]|nr:MAG: alkaline phosphatase [Deltaproteobacteria bacterium]